MRSRDLNNIILILIIVFSVTLNSFIIGGVSARENLVQDVEASTNGEIPNEIRENANNLIDRVNGTQTFNREFSAEYNNNGSDKFLLKATTKKGYEVSYYLEESGNLGKPNLGRYKRLNEDQYQYDEVFNNIDLRFTKNENDVLEEFIVSDKETALSMTELTESMKYDNLYYEVESDGSINFRDLDTSEFVFTIPKPVMYELNDKEDKNYGLHFEIYTDDDGVVYLKKVIDKDGKDWLVSSKRNYPVVIDATTVDTSTSVNATAYPNQRKLWYDGHFYWVSFYSYANSRVEFWYSDDGASWTENTSARLTAGYDYSIWGDDSALYVAYSSGYDIKVRKATGYPSSSFTWSSESTALDGLSSTDLYKYAYISVDTNGRIWVAAHHYEQKTVSVTDVTEDGYINSWGSRSNDNNVFGFGRGKVLWWYYQVRGYVEWNVASKIPYDADILDTDFIYHGYRRDYDGQIRDLKTYRPSTESSSDVYNDAGDGTIYINPTNFPQVASNQTVDLGTTADSDLENLLSDGWFAIGVRCDTEGSGTGESTIYAEEATSANPTPTLRVRYRDYAFEVVRSTNVGDITSWGTETAVAHSKYNYVTGTIVPLSSGKMYAVWQKRYNLEGSLYNGSSWGTRTTIVNDGISSSTGSISVVGGESDDNVHVVYLTKTNAYVDYIRYNGTAWGSAVTLDGTSTNYSPVITIDTRRSNNVHVAWVRNNSTIYYKRGISPYGSSNFTSTADTLESSGTNTWLTSSYTTAGPNDFITVAWTSGSSSPYSIKWYKRSLYQPGTCVIEEGADRDQVVVSWVDSNAQETHYEVQKDTNGVGYTALATLSANSTSYTDNSVSTGNTYQYRIRATDGVNESYWCYTSKLTFGVSSFGFEGVKLEGLDIN